MNQNEMIKIDNNKGQNERYVYIDLLKCIAIFIVVALHCGLWHINFINVNNVETLLQYSIRLTLEGVPLFMFINGFLIINKPLDIKKNLKKCLKIFSILIVWGLVLIFTISIIQGKKIQGIEYITILLNTKVNSSYTGILWFLQKLIIIYLFYPMVKKIYDYDFNIYKYLTILLVVSTFGTNLLVFVLDAISNGSNKEIINALISFINQFKVNITDNIYLLYFLIGGYVFKNKEKFMKIKYIFVGIISAIFVAILGIIVSMANTKITTNFNYNQLFLLFSILGLFSLCSRINIKNQLMLKIVSSIGKNTMGIYLIHMIIKEIINKFYFINDKNFITRFIISIIVFLISWCLTVVIRKIPKLSYIVKI